MNHPSARLAEFAAELKYEDIPSPVLRRAEDLMLDCLASVLAGSSARPVLSVARFADAMGPTSGPSENMVTRRSSSPLFAAMANAAAAHMVEQDDVHNGSVFHPGAVVFPPAIAVAQALGRSGKELLTACVAGYETGIRVGEFLGRSHYKIFHTTGTAGALAAAAAVGRLLNLNPEQMLNAFGSAGTQAAGLWEFLKDAADSKQLHTSHAAANGIMAAYLANDGFTGARRILEGAQGMGAGMSRDADPARLAQGLGSRWTVLETSFKYHASCRHTHPAADALLALIQAHALSLDDIARVEALVHQGAIDVLGPVVDPATVHQSKFSMGTVLGLIARHGRAGLPEFDAALNDPAIAAFRKKVTMALDPEVDRAYPEKWIGKVRVTTTDGRVLESRVDEPKGDPGNTLSRAELEDKTRRLATYRNAATPEEAEALIGRVWGLGEVELVGAFVVGVGVLG
ncbi:MmgE/PrpD family protein [Parapusillimonas granuli]|uniref:MmgE/PrpD family protein n=1 Tax=Parapusillimonas granuli TaxID=380911 RepID=A0A853G212_9BURK|nr:MmgE/PrpD family protein [Parapusillimonas granuli]MBB5214254.1 2-methylcitrate dehydratase PrpD [Parapusillimonas granuli]MEB2399081.1 MmgE/PrpD family protein [Alcaligenaceae bacterium]NYT51358.1 MmgE/PrpD family protein [Parapusillimonas granuli]